mmetsp:Transcript_35592/g.111903  ORF Transcript_35592/g.111903 Transcript_35592/m.111903 type:complete len:192 (-) Transcript_35592:228-803(-)
MELKTVIVGDTDVGKTTLSVRFCQGRTPTTVSPTVGGSFLQKDVLLKGTKVVLQLWDTAGQERFKSMAPLYYRSAFAAMLVFDLSKEDSWARIKQWRDDVVAHAEPGVAICVVGNKCDKEHSFSEEDAKAMTEELGSPVFRTSAFTGEGVEAAFTYLAERGLQVLRTKEVEDSDSVSLVPEIPDSTSSSCC